MSVGELAMLVLGIGGVIGVSWVLGVGKTPRDPDAVEEESEATDPAPESVPWTPRTRRRAVGNAAIPMVPPPAVGWGVAGSSPSRRRAPPRRRRVVRPTVDPDPEVDVEEPDPPASEDVPDYLDDPYLDDAPPEDVPRRVRQDRADRAPRGMLACGLLVRLLLSGH